MKKIFSLFTLFLVTTVFAQKQTSEKQQRFVMVVHGGAGTILKKNMTPEKEKAYMAGLQSALMAGYMVLNKGGSALDAVESAVKILEDNPLFNAGKGAVFTSEGRNELDAAIMNGKNLAAGSVASVTTIRHPISAARAVMEKSPHVMMIGKGAETFAEQNGLEVVDPKYFYTEERWRGLDRTRKDDSLKKFSSDSSNAMLTIKEDQDHKFGTVGAVACDILENIAAATSTGGMTNKQYGRIGDSPLIGIGTYANNKTCAISCTGHGEPFIRAVAAHDVSCLMEYKHLSLQQACEEVVLNKLVEMKGEGGLIAIDTAGNVSLVFNCAGMYRGVKSSDGKNQIAIYGD